MVKYEFIVSIVSSMEFNFVNKQSSVCVYVASVFSCMPFWAYVWERVAQRESVFSSSWVG